MKASAIYLILVWVSIAAGIAQVAPQKYFIEFTDKSNSPFSIAKPGEFLSQRAIERRQKQSIAIDPDDIPVNPAYVDRIAAFDIVVLNRSKWLNGITIFCANPAIIDSILKIPFVKRIIISKSVMNVYNLKPSDKFKSEEVSLEVSENDLRPNHLDYNRNTVFNYGPSYNQIHMLKGDSLHKLGFQGQGMVIAVLDAGFNHVGVLPAFDSLRLNNQILGTKDFVSPGNNVYNENEHGMEVLSCMGGNLPGLLVGTAPKADYWLLRTEDIESEYLIEEFNWVSAAEFADSAGADLINSSLGYTEFNDPGQSHNCNDMNGYTTPVTIGANFAFDKGMIVVNSAGNSGNSSWKCVSAPADGYLVMAVAAVDSNGIRAGFSSVGEATGRIKPNVAAMGQGTVVSSTIGTIIHNNGTSFSSPIMAGMTACFWQAFPAEDNLTILRAIELSCSQASSPDSLLGYGIPNFIKAMQHVDVSELPKSKPAIVYPNPFTDGLTVFFNSPVEQQFHLVLIDNLGRVIHSIYHLNARVRGNQVSIPEASGLKPGTYVIRMTGSNLHLCAKAIKMQTVK